MSNLLAMLDAAIYTFDRENNTWQNFDGGLSRLELLETNDSYIFQSQSTTVPGTGVLNVAFTVETAYQAQTDTFHCFSLNPSLLLGINFPSKEIADQFAMTVNACIENVLIALNAVPEPPAEESESPFDDHSAVAEQQAELERQAAQQREFEEKQAALARDQAAAEERARAEQLRREEEERATMERMRQQQAEIERLQELKRQQEAAAAAAEAERIRQQREQEEAARQEAMRLEQQREALRLAEEKEAAAAAHTQAQAHAHSQHAAAGSTSPRSLAMGPKAGPPMPKVPTFNGGPRGPPTSTLPPTNPTPKGPMNMGPPVHATGTVPTGGPKKAFPRPTPQTTPPTNPSTQPLSPSNSNSNLASGAVASGVNTSAQPQSMRIGRPAPPGQTNAQPHNLSNSGPSSYGPTGTINTTTSATPPASNTNPPAGRVKLPFGAVDVSGGAAGLAKGQGPRGPPVRSVTQASVTSHVHSSNATKERDIEPTSPRTRELKPITVPPMTGEITLQRLAEEVRLMKETQLNIQQQVNAMADMMRTILSDMSSLK